MINGNLTSGSPLVTAIAWFQSALLGTIGTSIAVVCVAAIGLAMLSGRAHLRRGMNVVIGCFVLFGAPMIAAGLRDLGSAGAEPIAYADTAPLAPAVSPLPAASTVPYDPYAGASVPMNR